MTVTPLQKKCSIPPLIQLHPTWQVNKTRVPQKIKGGARNQSNGKTRGTDVVDKIKRSLRKDTGWDTGFFANILDCA